MLLSLILAGQIARYDVVIANGTVIDGTGSVRRVADVGVRGDRIAAIGKLGRVSARRWIDAKGQIVAPGFIDTMGQSETHVLIDPRAQSKITQGITTEVTGEGGSIAVMTPYMKRENEGWYGPNLKIDWSDLNGYFRRLERRPPAINIATFCGAGGIRQAVLRDANRPPTARELGKMKSLVAQSMKQGALGVTTALIYPPGIYAKTDELVALARVAAQYGGIYATHMRNEGDGYVASTQEAIEIARRARIPLEIFHIKLGSKAVWGQMDQFLGLLASARKSGLDVTADQYPYIAASNGLAANIPAWAAEGGTAAMLARLRDPQMRERIKREMRTFDPAVDNDYLNTGGGKGIQIGSVQNPAAKKYEGKTLDEVARMMGQSDELDAMLDLILLDHAETSQIIYIMNEADVERAMREPWIGVCCDSPAGALDGPFSTGKPHPRAYGSFPRVLGLYVRERKILTLETAIHKMTQRSAVRFSLRDRGVLRPGAYADITVFDPVRVRDRATFADPHRLSEGIETVLVNGKIAVDRGTQTAVRAGRGLRGPGWKHAPSKRRES